MIVAGLAWRQARDRIRADRTSVELKAGAEVQTAKITSAQQLIDQLMTQSTADRTLIATLQTELAELTADHRRLDRTLTQVLSGAYRLHAQVVELQVEPVWSPDHSSKEIDPKPSQITNKLTNKPKWPSWKAAAGSFVSGFGAGFTQAMAADGITLETFGYGVGVGLFTLAMAYLVPERNPSQSAIDVALSQQ